MASEAGSARAGQIVYNGLARPVNKTPGLGCCGFRSVRTAGR
jgi:hypothetical protein